MNKMNKSTLLTACSLLLATIAIAQQNKKESTNQFIDIGLGLGSSQTSVSGSYIYNWNLGQKGKFFIGTGARFTSYFGKNINFTSAPSNLASDDKNVDTLIAPKPSINALNVLINLGYNFSPKFQIGFNIDALGFSFGPTGSPTYRGAKTSAKPTSGNILLVGNNDKGSLNSHFYARYTFNKNWGVSAGYEYLFTELKTDTKVQTAPEQNDRFRNKSSEFYIGVSYKIR
jgi:Outer membrane protein beta-barrel domain